MPQSATDRYAELFLEMENSKAMVFLASLKGFESNYYAYARNYEDLLRFLELTERIGPHVTAVDGPDKESNARKTYKELTRLVFNFLSAAKARIDYTRAFVKDTYAGSAFEDAYKGYIKEKFAEDELCSFVHDLRNYIVHKGIPHISLRTNWSTSEVYAYIDKARVINSSSWKAHSKSFLSKQGEHLRLSPLFMEYGDKIKAQTDWIIRELYRHHSSDVEKLRQLQIQLEAARNEMRRGKGT